MPADTFENRISIDWLWREKELREMDARLLKPTSAVGTKASMLIVYSHWEGHFKLCATQVLEFICEGVQRKVFKWTDLKQEIRQRLIFCSFRKSSIAGVSHEAFIGYLNALNDSRYGEALKATDEVIMIDSNLNATRAEAICRNLGVAYSWCALKRVIIDERILAYRNAFAHGANRLRSGDEIDMKSPDIIEAINEARILIRETKDNFSNGIVTRDFLGR